MGLAYRAVSALPRDFEEMGSLLHEVGHLLRARVVDQDMEKARSELYEDIFHRKWSIARNYIKKSELSEWQLRKLWADDERSPWAIALSLIREVGKSIKLDITSAIAVERISKMAEYGLSTYDLEMPYSLSGYDEDKQIPAFSQTEKKLQLNCIT